MKQMTAIITMTLILLTINVLSYGTDYYVDAVKGDNAKTGTSADDPWKTITYAISEVTALPRSPAIIHIAAETYNQNLGENFPINMKNNTHLIGENRDTTIIDGTGSEMSVISSENADNVVIEGLTVTGGEGTLENVNGTDLKLGGGLYLGTSIIEINNCVIKVNFAELGGGIYITQSTVTIINCQILANTATRSDGFGSGGGIFFTMSSPSIKNSTISNNKSNMGGGIEVFNSSPKITSCVIENNQAIIVGDIGGNGGGISLEKTQSTPEITDCSIIGNKAIVGGGIFCYQSSPEIKNCQIIDNSTTATVHYSSGGGGIYCMNKSSPSIEDCIIKENEAGYGGGINIYENCSPIITNCKIENNTGNKYGGAFYYEEGSLSKIISTLIVNNFSNQGGAIVSKNASPKFNLCTIVGNTGSYANGFYAMNGGTPTITSSIIWNNGNYPIATQQATVIVKYSDIQYGYEGDGNITSDPKFVTGPRGDYYLSQKAAEQDANSPCVNAGSEVPIMGFNPSDYITRTDGGFDTGSVDMGYHYRSHLAFDLSLDPVKTSYTGGDNITLKFDVTTAPIVITTGNIYLIMVDPDGNYYSAMSWNKGLQPLVQGLSVPANLNIAGSPLFSFTIPSAKPLVTNHGTYTFYLAALKPGTTDFISNVATVSFDVQ
jgi:hypothetical protein